MGRLRAARQYFELPEYGWRVYVYYHVRNIHAGEILSLLESVGVPEADRRRAAEVLTRGLPDTGLCCSNTRDRASVLVVSAATSARQFMNSLMHEARHLERHVERTLGIDPFSEEAAYLAGRIGELMYGRARLFLCSRHGRAGKS